jgi:hypothetical protein
MRLRKEYRLLRARGNIYRAGDVTEEIRTLYDLERGSLTILDQRTLLKIAGARESDLDWEQPYLDSI